MVLTNYKYTKLLFFNALRCNHLPTKTTKKKKKNNVFSFLNIRLARIFNFFEVRAFTKVMLKILAFNTLKSYFIYFYYLTL